jgi:hypothetical protein
MICVGVVGLGSRDDDLAPLPLIGLVAGVVVQLIGASYNERHRNAWRTEGKEIEPPYSLSQTLPA